MHAKFTPLPSIFADTRRFSRTGPMTVVGRSMLLLVASVVALLLGIAVMPWRARQPPAEFSAGLVVTLIAGCTFMGLGLGGAILGAIILLVG